MKRKKISRKEATMKELFIAVAEGTGWGGDYGILSPKENGRFGRLLEQAINAGNTRKEIRERITASGINVYLCPSGEEGQEFRRKAEEEKIIRKQEEQAKIIQKKKKTGKMITAAPAKTC